MNKIVKISAAALLAVIASSQANAAVVQGSSSGAFAKPGGSLFDTSVAGTIGFGGSNPSFLVANPVNFSVNTNTNDTPIGLLTWTNNVTTGGPSSGNFSYTITINFTTPTGVASQPYTLTFSQPNNPAGDLIQTFSNIPSFVVGGITVSDIHWSLLSGHVGTTGPLGSDPSASFINGVWFNPDNNTGTIEHPGPGYVSTLQLTADFTGPTVPEASTWAMMILGFAGVGFMAYRRRSQGIAFRFA